MVVRRVASALFASVLLAIPVVAQLSQFGEVIDVRVINVDAVVTGPNGVPVRGLGAEEFELRVDGRVVPISYFAALEDGHTIEAGVPVESGSATRPYLALVWDQRAFRPKDAAATLGTLVERLPALIESTRGIMIARQGTTLGIEQSFSTDQGLLTNAISRLDDRTAVSFARGERTLLRSRLARALRPEDAKTSEEARLVREQADRLLQEINLQAQQERQEALAGLDQLRQLVSLLSNLPGRKSVLYLGGGIQTRPAEPLYRAWHDKYDSIANRLRVPSFGGRADLTDVTSGFVSLTTAANNHRVAFYTHDLSGARSSAASVEFATVEAAEFATEESIDRQQNLLGLATSTGGLGVINRASVGPLLDGLLRDLQSYYSLGFELSDVVPRRGRIELRVRSPNLRVRHFDRFDDTAAGDQLREAAMTALLTDQATNPLEISVEVGAGEKQRNGTYVVPLLVKVPISHLALLPQGNRHVGKLSVVVVARSADGDLSAPSFGEVPVEIENTDLLAAMSRLAGYRLRVQVSPGEQTIAIGLRDDVALRLSTINLLVDTGQGS